MTNDQCPMTMPFDQSLIAIRPYHSPLAIRQSLPFSVVADSHANIAAL
ncbi:MAG: hypothetical protein OXFUSZZB_000420 [Candidatus Fervidibacter sp.]|jgi:hypothetical protein